MKELEEEHQRIKRYLLGDSTEAEQQRVEEQLMVDDDYREQAYLVETELIDEYVAGSLSGPEREKFERHFLSHPRQVQRVRIARVLRLYADGEAGGSTHAASRRAQKKKPASFLSRLRPAAPALAAALLVLLALGSWALYRRWQRQQERAEIVKELARLNSQVLGGPGPEHSAGPTLVVKLLPVHLRNIEASKKIVVTPGASVMELWLSPTNDEYQTYRVKIQRPQEPEALTIDGLRATADGPGKVIIVRVPTRILIGGDYQVTLSGLTAADRLEDDGDYYFRIAGP